MKGESIVYYQTLKNVEEVKAGNGHSSFPMLSEKNGCTNGCCAGISRYASTEYTPVATHDDQEGFIVLSGTGWAKIGEEEFHVEPETAFIAPANTPHQMKADSSGVPLMLFWFHASSC